MNLAAASAAPNATRNKHSIAAFVAWFLAVFLVLFPKGGIKAGGIPLTWGYLFLGISLPPLALIRFFGLPLRFKKKTLLALASLVPFQVLFLYDIAQFGIFDPGSVVSALVTFFVLPLAFLAVYPAYQDRIDGIKLARVLCACMLGAAVFGIFLFFYYPITKSLIEIPYLTVNADDYGLIAQTKHINRGIFLKLISTYNNGNLYGVATLILLPLYTRLEPKSWKHLVIRLALILTLSRSIWLGLIIEQLLSLVRVGWDAASTFPRVVFGPALRRGLVLVGTIVAILIGLVLSSGNLSFLFDEQLGGRSEYIGASLQHLTFTPGLPFIGFLEVIYSTALETFGVLGLLSFLLIFLTPIFLLLSDRRIVQSRVRMAALKGLIIYIVVAAADGAILLIPVMAFYWFAYMVFLEGWPGDSDRVLQHDAAILPPGQSSPSLLSPSAGVMAAVEDAG